MEEAKAVNDTFGIPPAVAQTGMVETPEQRMSRLRALAQAEIDKETDAEIVARMVAEERARRAEELLPKDTSGWPAEYDKIEIAMGNQKHDLPYVPLGLNGFCIKAPRGKPIILPHVFVTECLDHAIEEITVQSQGGLITRPARRFPYQFLGKATPEEYKQYITGQKAQAEREIAAKAA